jgi:hypothetical protein
MLGFFHSGAVHVETFNALVQAEQSGIDMRHTVREDLLASAVAGGSVTNEIAHAVQREIRALLEQGARVVVCTCSTLGNAAEATAHDGRATILRVDRPLAEQLVATGRPILVVAALPSAMTTAVELLTDIAQHRTIPVNLRQLPCYEAWPRFLAGDRLAYAQHVANAVNQHAAPGDRVMLAQASMATAVPLIQGRDVEVATTPAPGIRAALAAHARITT